jgi:hypothetical protein
MKMTVFWDITPCKSCRSWPAFQRCLLPPSSGRRVTHRPDGGGSTHLWNAGQFQRDCTEQCPRRLSFWKDVLITEAGTGNTAFKPKIGIFRSTFLWINLWLQWTAIVCLARCNWRYFHKLYELVFPLWNTPNYFKQIATPLRQYLVHVIIQIDNIRKWTANFYRAFFAGSV